MRAGHKTSPTLGSQEDLNLYHRAMVSFASLEYCMTFGQNPEMRWWLLLEIRRLNSLDACLRREQKQGQCDGWQNVEIPNSSGKNRRTEEQANALEVLAGPSGARWWFRNDRFPVLFPRLLLQGIQALLLPPPRITVVRIALQSNHLSDESQATRKTAFSTSNKTRVRVHRVICPGQPPLLFSFN